MNSSLWHLVGSDGSKTTIQNTEMPRVRLASVAGTSWNSSGRFFVLGPLVSPHPNRSKSCGGMASNVRKRTPLPTLGTGANRLTTHPEEDCSVARWGNQIGDVTGSHSRGSWSAQPPPRSGRPSAWQGSFLTVQIEEYPASLGCTPTASLSSPRVAAAPKARRRATSPRSGRLIPGRACHRRQWGRRSETVTPDPVRGALRMQRKWSRCALNLTEEDGEDGKRKVRVLRQMATGVGDGATVDHLPDSGVETGTLR
jgi:hypothetical protein